MNPITTPLLKTTDVGSAVILAANTTAALTAGTTTGVNNINQLRNPLQVPILVDEIIFNIDQTTAFQTGIPSINGGDLRVQLRLGTDQITQAYVPIWSLGKSHNMCAGANSTGGSAGGAVTNIQLNSSIYGMRLSSELILYPGEYIEPMFYHAGVLDTGSITPRIIVKGRAMSAGAKRQSLPWVSFFAGVLQPANANATEETRETDLVNPFGVPLYVDRMSGLIAARIVSGPSVGIFGPYGIPAAIDAGLNYCLMRLADESGRPIIRDQTPLGHIFQMQTYTWEMKSTMPPNSFYKAYLAENYGSINSAVYKLQAYLSLIGKRAVKS